MYYFDNIQPIISHHQYKIIGNVNDIAISDVSLIGNGNSNSLIWLGAAYFKENQKDLSEINASLIITDVNVPDTLLKSKCVQIKTDQPRLLFSKIVTELFIEKLEYQIHSSTVIHPEAQIAPNVYIGPNCTIGKAIIGPGTRIVGNTFIHDNVTIGNNCLIDACCVIGADGFGHVKDENNEWYKFPHIGGTILEDNVEVGANTYITKGALKNTHIKKGVKIALSVCIGHNVLVGENSIVLSNSIIGGSTIIGDDCWISIAASIKNGLKIGSKAIIGMGAVVTKNVEKGKVMVGNPAKELVKK